jgi:hypothetical protein
MIASRIPRRTRGFLTEVQEPADLVAKFRQRAIVIGGESVVGHKQLIMSQCDVF